LVARGDARSRASAALRGFFREATAIDRAALTAGLPERDGDLARELVSGVLRNRVRLDYELSHVSRFPLEKLAPGVREALEVALYPMRFLDRIPVRASVHEGVEEARRRGGEGASRLANAVLRRLARERVPLPAGDDAASLAALFSHPTFLVERWLARFGLERTRSILAADNERGALSLLFDARRTDASSLLRELAEEGVIAEPSPLSSCGLRVTSGHPLRTAAFRDGRLYVADIGSQILVKLLPAGGALLDLAAAPGGKSIAALFSGLFDRAFALDRSLSRMPALLQNRRRLRLAALAPAAADLRRLPIALGSASRVLLDAPCTGTGTLRKNPEIRYRLHPEAIAGLAATQRELLAAASRVVAPGGFLLYSTCSLEAEENEGVVAAFLADSADFAPAGIDAPPELRPFVDGHRFRIFPDHGSDGFTAHLLRRFDKARVGE
jgi:16S rRNA (cytosine967-C5)-methyltransferase